MARIIGHRRVEGRAGMKNEFAKYVYASAERCAIFVVVGDEIATFQRVFGLDSVG